MRNKIVNKVCDGIKSFLIKKRFGGTKAILIEVILVLLAVGAVLLFKESVLDMIEDVVAKCKTIVTSLIS